MKGKTLLAIIALAVFIPLAALAGDFVETPAPKDFRGIAFGDKLQDLEELIPVPGAGFKDTYYRKSEQLTFGQADIISVAYYFRKDALYSVGMVFEGEANYFLIKDKLIRDFGPGRQVGAQYGWMWPEFSMVISYNSSQRQGSVRYTYEGKPKDS